MSWARIDDEAWHHEKFEQLQAEGPEGMAAIGLWAMALSFTGQKRSAKVSLAEATMLCGGDRELASRCFVLLHDTCLADLPPCFRSLDDSLASKTPSIILHNWIKYRSKDEAKAQAGRKGGEKSAETRRRKSKQSPSRAEAKPKQTSSTPPSPDPKIDTSRQLALNAGTKKVWDHWLVKKPATRRTKLLAKHPEARLIKKRLADYQPQDLCKAIDGMYFDEWSVNHGKLDIGWALRQDDKNNNVDRFIELATTGPPPQKIPGALQAAIDFANEDEHDHFEERVRGVFDAPTRLLPVGDEDR